MVCVYGSKLMLLLIFFGEWGGEFRFFRGRSLMCFMNGFRGVSIYLGFGIRVRCLNL